jgi:hypothetical protein
LLRSGPNVPRTWLWIALVLVALFAILYYSDALDRRFDRAGIPFGALVVWVGTALVFLAGGRKVFGTGPIIVSRPTRSLSIGKASSRLCNHLAQLVSAWL